MQFFTGNYPQLILCTAFLTVFGIGFGLSDHEASAQVQNVNFSMDYEQDSSLLKQASFSNALETGRVGKKHLSNKKAIKAFYSQHYGAPVWIERDFNLKRSVHSMFQAIEEAWTHGLNPYNYHYYEIYQLLDKENAESRAELELLLTDAFTRYSVDMSGMRLDAKKIDLDATDWKQRKSAFEAVSYLGGTNNINQLLDTLEPKGKTYKKLRQELIRLVNEGPEKHEELLPITFTGLLKPGWGHKTIPQIREYFGLNHPYHERTRYDDTLAAAVMRFQRENGLKADGIIGPNTLKVINRTTDKKIEQIVANMERLRWVNSQERGDKFVIVNLPSAKLWAIEDGKVDFEMPVIVGRSGRETKSFKTYINGLRLNPDWTVPPTIKRVDILPKVQENYEYLLKKGIELFEGFGREAITLDPASIEWDSISWRELNRIRMVQGPGDNNPLGRYRVLMPNDYNMYLHDTNKPELFEKNDRALSSGCIRMKYPEKMAEFLLKDIDGWSDSKTNEILASYKKTDIRIPQNIPVYVFYYTTWLDDRNQIVYGNDIYDLDEKLVQEIQKIDGFHIPVHNKNRYYSNTQLVSYQQ